MSIVLFPEAIEGWKKAIGVDDVITHPDTLKIYCKNVSGLTRQILAILRPKSTLEVQSLVRVANTYKIPLYPLSCGRNFGLGSRLPVRDGCAIVDLGRMNRIHAVSVDHHYAIVEPGVTQGILHDHLTQNNIPLILNVTGSAIDASLLGNALERGIGYFSTRADCLSGMEIVLGNGEILRTGYAHFPNAKTTYTYRYGIGPSLDGLFFQSNYGIVTSAGIDLIPKPQFHAALIASLLDERNLGDFVDVLADLRKDGIFQTVVHIGNRNRMEITLGPMIYEVLKGQNPNGNDLPKQAVDLIKAEKAYSWSAAIGLLGTQEQVMMASRVIKRRLTKFAKVSLLTDQMLANAEKITGRLSFIPFFYRKNILLKAVKPLHGLTKGIPTDAALGSLYWPIGEIPPDHQHPEPDQSPCGMLYCLPMMPLKGTFAIETMQHTENLFKRHGFIPYTTLNIIDAKTLEAVITLAFDTRKPDRVTAAHQCIEETQQYFIQEGLLPYRVGVQSMMQVVHENDFFWKTARDLKKVFDPNHIIAPGRYNLV